MRITTFTDFGLRTLIYLASLPPETLTNVQEVSKIYNVSQNHLVKVVGQLRKLGYIHTLRGKNGGIHLAKPPAEINIGEVIEQLENHLDVVDCASPACQLTPCCKLRHALKDAMQAFIASMKQFTLADMMINQDELAPLLFIDRLDSNLGA